VSRFQGEASVRRAFIGSDDAAVAVLSLKPDGLDWQWYHSPPGRGREALACALAAISGGWKLYIALPDDPNSIVLEIVGLAKTPDRG
jgi:hypothetical protein